METDYGCNDAASKMTGVRYPATPSTSTTPTASTVAAGAGLLFACWAFDFPETFLNEQKGIAI